MADIATLGLRVDADGAIRAVKDFGDESERTAHKAEGLERTAHRLTEAFVGYEAVRWAKETLELGARYQTLGVVMNVVGANAGKSAAQMANLQASLQQTGISMIESRNNLARMAQAHLNLADATRLARVAQDAAVIGNINSSEAFERLIHGIEAAEPMILRSIGINVGFEESYVKAGRAVGKTRDELSEHERTQIRANAVIESGARIAGTYEAAMGTAGKQINSTTRYLEDARVKVSEAFQPQFTQAVFAYADALKFAGEHAGSIAGALKLVITAGELAATVYAGKLIVSGAAWVASLVAQRAATIATAAATAEATALEATAAQVRLAAATNRLRANTALLASDETLIAAEHGVALAQTRVAMTADAAAASELALARASTVAGVAITTAGTLAARGWALIGGPIGAAMIAAIGINALLDKWIDKQMKAVELTEDQEAAFQRALAAAHAHAPPKPEDPAAETERQRKAKELLNERQGELAKQTALNAAFGQSDSVLKAMGIRYDAMIQQSQDAKNSKGHELAALNAVTDALAKQKIRADELVAAQARRDQLRDVGFASAATIRQAEQEVQLIGLSTDSLNRKRIAFEAINKSAEAEIVLSKALEHADAKQAVTAFEVYSKTMQAIRATADLATAGADTTEQMRMLGEAGATAADQQAKAIALAKAKREEFAAPFKNLTENIQREFGTLFSNIFTDGIRSFNNLGDAVRNIFARVAGEVLSLFATRRLVPALMGTMGFSSPTVGAAGAGQTNYLGGLGSQIAGQAAGGGLAGGFIGYGVGASLYSQSHGGFGNAARGALGGAASGAAAGFMVGGPIGAAVGGLAGFVGGMPGVGSAAKEAAKADGRGGESGQLSMDSLRATVKGDTLGQAIAGCRSRPPQRRKQIEDAWSGGGANSDRVQWRTKKLKEMNALEDERIAKLREEYALSRPTRAKTSRCGSSALRATRKKRTRWPATAADREIAQAIADHRSDEYIATLKYVTGLELATNAMDKASTSALNMVEGYNIVAEAFRFSGNTTGMTAGGGYGGASVSGPLAVPTGGSRGTPQPTAPIIIENILQLDGREIARNSKKVYIDEASRSADGDSYNWGRGPL
jgi:hypothetical protein